MSLVPWKNWPLKPEVTLAVSGAAIGAGLGAAVGCTQGKGAAVAGSSIGAIALGLVGMALAGATPLVEEDVPPPPVVGTSGLRFP
jgi:hypothetical protein